MRPIQTQIHISNIQSQARNEEVEKLLTCVGPLVDWKPKREGDIKFSAVAEYYDEFTAQVAVNLLNGYKFQNRELKAKLYGNPGAHKILPYQIEKVQYKTSNTYDINNIQLDEFYNNLTMNKKLAIFIELKLTFNHQLDKLQELLSKNQKMCEVLLKIQRDVIKEFKTQESIQQIPQYQDSNNNDDNNHFNSYNQINQVARPNQKR